MKKFYSFVLIITLLCGITANVYAEEEIISAFSEISASKVSNVNNLEVANGVIGATYSGSWAEFKNIDFGEKGVSGLDIKIGVPQNYAGAKVSFHIDSVDTEKFAELTVSSTGSFTTRTWQQASVYESDITGVHNLYIKYYTSGTGDIEALRMTEYISAEAALIPGDVGEEQSDAFSLLYALGALEWDEKSSFGINKKITAGEFVSALVKLKGGDLEEKEKLLSAFELLEKSKITNKQAVGIIDIVLNRNDYKNAIPASSNVTMAVDDLKINGSEDKEIVRADMLDLLYQACDAEVFSFDGIEYDDNEVYVKYTARENNTLLSHYRDIYSSDGIVTMDHITGLDSVSDLSEDELLIDGYLFKGGNCNIKNLLGYKVKFYYIQGEEENELVYIKRVDDPSNIVINSEDIVSYKNRILTYEGENGREKTKKIPKETRIVYNGLAASVYSDKLFDIKYGNIEFIHRNGDLCCVRINSVTNYKLAKFYDNTLYFDGTDYKINLDATGVEYVMTNKFGKELDASMISDGAVCTVAQAQSMDGSFTYYTIMISQKNTVGSVSYINGTKKSIRIADREYEFAASVSDETIRGISVGSNIKAYFDVYSRVAFVEVGKSTEMLGYLVNCYADDIEEIYSLKIFDEKGVMQVYECAEKVSINGVTHKDNEVLGELKPGGVMKNELVLFKINSRSEVSKIVFAANNTSTDKNNGLYKYYDATGMYKSATRSWGGKTILSGDFILFRIPTDKKDSESYSVGKPTFYNDETVNMVCYNREPDKLNVTVGVKEYDPSRPGNISSGQDISYVSHIEQTLNNYDEVLYKIEFYDGTGKNKKELFVADSCSASVQNLKVGDGVRFSTNNKNEIVELNRMFSAADNDIFAGSTSFNAEVQILKGKVYKTQDMLLQFDRNGEVFDYSSAAVYVYYPRKKIIELGTASDILDSTSAGADAQTVFVYAHRSSVRSIVIVK